MKHANPVIGVFGVLLLDATDLTTSSITLSYKTMTTYTTIVDKRFHLCFVHISNVIVLQISVLTILNSLIIILYSNLMP
jgi:hypothetical protein